MTWSSALLGEVAEIVSGSTPKTGTSEYWDGHIPWVTPADLTKLKSQTIEDTPRKLTESGFASCGARVLPINSVLFSSRAPIGHVAITGVPMATNQGFKSFVPDRERLDSKFLYWWLKSKKEYLQGLGVGATFKEVSKSIVAGVRIPIPPLPEQRRIASILDQADDLRARRRRSIAHLDQLESAVFSSMFGDVTRNSHNFAVAPFSDIGQLDRGVSRARPRNSPRLLGGDHPLVQTGEVAGSGGYIRTFTQTYSDEGLAQSKRWPAGTLAITIAANIAKTGVLTFPACFPDSVVGFTPEPSRTNVEYVRFWLRSLQATLERQAPASAQKNINLSILRALQVPVPPITAQAQFASKIASIESLKGEQGSHLAKLDELFASLQHRAFSGQL